MAIVLGGSCPTGGMRLSGWHLSYLSAVQMAAVLEPFILLLAYGHTTGYGAN